MCIRDRVNRDNHEIESTEGYYRVTISIPFLDHLINEVEERFDIAPATVVKGFNIIPSIFLGQNDDNWKSDFMEFVERYSHDFPSLNSISPELHLWETFWQGKLDETLPSSVSKTLEITHEMKQSFPNIYMALKILATVPVTSCECERAVSVLRRLKTYLRSTMEQERLNGLSLMTIHRDISLDYDEILNRFAREHPRRMELLDVLTDDI